MFTRRIIVKNVFLCSRVRQCKPSPNMPTQTIFYLLALAIDFGNSIGQVMHNGHVGVQVRSARIFGYQHVGIGDARLSRLGSIGPATRCDATHPRWNVLKPLRCIEITCDALRWVFQHVGISAPDFGISLLFIVRCSNGLDHCDGH